MCPVLSLCPTYNPLLSGGTQGAIPPSCSPSHLAIALWHYLTGSKCSSHEQLKHIPAEVLFVIPCAVVLL